MNCEEIAAWSKRAGDDDALLIMGELQPLSGKQLFIDILRPLHQAALADEADRLITQGEQRDEEAQRGTGFTAIDRDALGCRARRDAQHAVFFRFHRAAHGAHAV